MAVMVIAKGSRFDEVSVLPGRADSLPTLLPDTIYLFMRLCMWLLKGRALVISVTRPGKTVLAAFYAQNFKATRRLFIVHRESVSVRVMKAFQVIFGDINRKIHSLKECFRE